MTTCPLGYFSGEQNMIKCPLWCWCTEGHRSTFYCTVAVDTVHDKVHMIKCPLVCLCPSTWQKKRRKKVPSRCPYCESPLPHKHPECATASLSLCFLIICSNQDQLDPTESAWSLFWITHSLNPHGPPLFRGHICLLLRFRIRWRTT